MDDSPKEIAINIPHNYMENAPLIRSGASDGSSSSIPERLKGCVTVKCWRLLMLSVISAASCGVAVSSFFIPQVAISPTVAVGIITFNAGLFIPATQIGGKED